MNKYEKALKLEAEYDFKEMSSEKLNADFKEKWFFW